ncbi:hypothetical protein PC113_g19542 [Phytophthora cactorum]|uniref:Uncharacterized protein n=2 Tax=Phytophthora cactorum TaxID=29920 RepID=A0A8T0YCZ6_9STRA|nr:hypothetical protein PC113_g19542 [Phytophthora cactorum]
MSSMGLRNWRGEIIQAKAAITASSESDANNKSLTAHEFKKTEPPSPPSDDRRPMQKKILCKDEFGRDVEVVVNEKRHKKSNKDGWKEDRKKERKHKHKHKKKHKHHRDKNSDRSRSPSPRGRLVGTPPPADPFRPQLDEDRGRRSQRRTHHRNHEPMVTDVTLIGAPLGVVAEVEAEIVVKVRHLLGLIADARRPQWSASGLTTPSTIAARVHRERSIHFIDRNLRLGFHEQAACTWLANSITSWKRRIVRNR